MIKEKKRFFETEEPVVDFSGEGIVKAEQMYPNTRYAKRQVAREEVRHWKIEYKE